MNSIKKNGIARLRANKDWSYQNLADAVSDANDGLETSKVQMMRLEKGIRKLSPEWIERLAKAFEVTNIEVLEDTPEYPNTPPGSASFPVIGYVQAGAWQSALEIPAEDQEHIALPVAGFPLKDRCFVLEVKGNSMNKAAIPEGAYLLCINLHDFPRDLRSGDRVITHRHNEAGEMEATVKELEIREDGAHWLWPRSDDPAHQAPIQIPPIDEQPQDLPSPQADEIYIPAVAVGVFHTFLDL